MDFLIFQVPILMVQASLDGILLGILFALIAYGMALQWGVMKHYKYSSRRFSNSWWLYYLFYVPSQVFIQP
jgi:membrane protein CcdC involved in cytochrome C biogenesis